MLYLYIINTILIKPVSSLCTDIIIGCNSCIDDNNCRTCNAGYGLKIDPILGTTVCYWCGGCSGTYNYCREDKPGWCYMCSIYYHFNAGSCIQCTQSTCKICDSDVNTCNECYNGYAPNLSGICSTCIDPNCIQCITSPTNCIRCEINYGVDLVTNIGTCIPCLDTNCFRCMNDASICQYCMDSYGLSGNSCILCSIAGCLNCNSDSATCWKC